MGNEIKHLEITCSSLPWLSHWMLYGCGWAKA